MLPPLRAVNRLAARKFLGICKSGRHDRGALLILHYAAGGKMAPSPYNIG